MAKIAVVFGGPSPEHDINILTGLQATRELVRSSHQVSALYWSKAGDWYAVSPALEAAAFLEGVPRGADPVQLVAASGGGFVPVKKGLFSGKTNPLPIDVVVNCCHGVPGEDGTLQGALDLAGIAYTGPTVAAAALGMDKLAFAGVMQAAGIKTLPRLLLTNTTESVVDFDGPYIVKPRFGGSSIGIEIVDTIDTAKALLRTSPHFRSGAVVESYRPESFDLNVAIRRFPQLQFSAIEKPTRSVGHGGAILGYADKYVGGEGMVSAPRELPADIPPSTTNLIRETSAVVAELCGVRGVARLDFLADADEIYVNEINTIPGSLAKHLWVEPTLPFAELLNDMITEAVQLPATHYTTSGADGSALRSAGAIAGKLS